MADTQKMKEAAALAADAATRGAQDVMGKLRDRLSNAPRLSTVTQAEASVVAATEALARAEAMLASQLGHAGYVHAEARRHQTMLEDRHRTHVGPTARGLVATHLDGLPAHLAAGFDDPAWAAWTPPGKPVALTFADPAQFHLRWGGPGAWPPDSPDWLPFAQFPLIGGGTWIIEADEASDAGAKDLLRALVLRLACTLPQQSRFAFLDPLGFGQTFPMQRSLPAVRETGADLAQDLQRIQADIRRIIRDVVGYHESFEAVPAEQQAAERYEFIFAADFPKAKAYDRRLTEMLFDIGRAGPRAGRHLILHVVAGHELPRDMSFDQLGPVRHIRMTGPGPFRTDAPPPPAEQKRLLDLVRGAAPARHSASLGDVLPRRARWWTGNAARRVEATLDGQKDGLEIVFGQRDDGSEMVHGMLAAAAGSGKSNLFHALLLGLATRYPPEELQLYLMDLKQGVEFQPYARLPHAAVVAYNTDPALARAVLSELKDEMVRRYEQAFRPAGVQKLEDYRAAGQPGGPLPRLLLLVDEYQALFQSADAQEVSTDLLALSTQGRAAGIHMLLGSQSFGAPGMQGSAQIFNNINLRMAMRLPAAAAQAMIEFEREGKEMLRGCDLPGRVLVNTAAGRDGANRFGQVVLVPAEDRASVLDGLAEMAASWPAAKRDAWPRTQVFDGSRAPVLADHPLAQAASAQGPLEPPALAALAGSSRALGGFGRGDWRAGDGPVPVVLGRDYAVHGHAIAVLRRLPAQNLLMMGASAAARLGMIGGLLASAASLSPTVLGTVRVLDMSGDGAVADLLARFGPRCSVVRDPALAQAAIEAPAAAAPDLLLLIEPDRVPALLRPVDPLARAAGPDALEQRLRVGPLDGRFTALACTGLASLGRVLGRRGANAFSWRAVTQMSQEDSQDLLGNRLAAQLRDDGRRGPEAALLADVDGNRFTRFMPYAV